MAIAIALLGFNDLGCSVTPTFLFRNNVGSLKKFKTSDGPRDMESCHLAAARRMKLWSLNVNLFFKEPQQLTKFT